MCGIAGVISSAVHSIDADASAMARSLAHRGPDDHGLWSDRDANVALTHRRLSIVDLSSAGHQPMTSASGRYVITYNGEVYNFQTLRAELEARGITFRGHSDTEIILEGFSVFGITATVERLNGMFAIAVWDRHDRTLSLIRDRLGIKPLYWAQFGGLFLFASELKALRAYPGWTARIDRRSVASFMQHNYVPGPHTIYEDVHKLEPGAILTLPWGGRPAIERYWDAGNIARAGLASPLQASDAEMTDELEDLLKDAVARQMIADVPLGAFLSGGVDSSTVVALMQAVSPGKVRTFTIGFEAQGFDEAPYAAAVARHLGTQHTELKVTAQEALNVIPRLADDFDEPFGDSSQIPTYLVSGMTRKYVTVALSGDGGDELFAGYSRYKIASRLWAALSLLPAGLRKELAEKVSRLALSPGRLTSALPPRLADRAHRLAGLFGQPDDLALYRRLISHWEPAHVMVDGDNAREHLWDGDLTNGISGYLEKMQLIDLVTYLPDDILTKVDRASMAVALEARVPLLDHRIAEFAWRLPRSAKVRNGKSKWLLRQVLNRHVPDTLINRPKMGFGVPLSAWLRGPLHDWAESLLDERRLREAGLLDVKSVRKVWREHMDGTRNWQYQLWDVLMLEAWRERWGNLS